MTPYYQDSHVTLHHGDVRAVLATLPDESIHCCVTSPPYWGLRDYGTATWLGGDPACSHVRVVAPRATRPPGKLTGGTLHVDAGTVQRGDCVCGAARVDPQIGLESTPDEYVAALVDVFRQVRRVLRADGTLWLNLGDSYANDGKWGGETGGLQAYLDDNDRRRVGREKRITGLKPKDLVGIPWRVAFALQADGWYLRSDIIWHKPNPMPESVQDRPTKAHEYLFLLSKAERYFYDARAIAEPSAYPGGPNAPDKIASPHGQGYTRRTDKQRGHSRRHAGFNDRWDAMSRQEQQSLGRNKRTVWTIEATGNREAECLAIIESQLATEDKWNAIKSMMSGAQSDVWRIATRPYAGAHFATFPPDLITPCILAGCPEGGTVLDPFGGSGTTGHVAKELGRKAILIELNADYCALAVKRWPQHVIDFGGTA